MCWLFRASVSEAADRCRSLKMFRHAAQQSNFTLVPKLYFTLTLTLMCLLAVNPSSCFFSLHLHELARSRIVAPSACWKFFRLARVGRMRRVDDVRGLNRDQLFFSLARRRFTGENQTSFSDSSLTLISISAAHYRVPPTSPRHAAPPDMTIHHGDLRRRHRGRRNFCLAAG